MGCANSKHGRCRHCGHDPYSPEPRSYSMPAGYRRLHRRDGYHIVALTSSSMGSLKLEISNQDSSASTSENGDDKKVRNGYDKLKCNCSGIAENEGERRRKDYSLEMIEAKTWSKMINEKVSKVAPKTPIVTPPGEPETINTWELMEGLEDTTTIFLSPRQSKSSSFSAARGSPSSPDISSSKSQNGTGWRKPIWLQSTDDETDSRTSTVVSDFDRDVISSFRKSLETLPQDNALHLQPLEKELDDAKHCDDDIKSTRVMDYKMCQPASKDKVVFYFTSLRGIRKTYEDCCNARLILKSIGVILDERDVSMHSGFKEELKELLKDESLKAGLPKVFVGKKYIGGAEEIVQLHEEGQLEEVLEGCPKVADGGTCEACGDMRFVPCETCSGSCKIYYDRDDYEEEEEEDFQEGEYGFQRCPDCNENGLIRCPICCN